MRTRARWVGIAIALAMAVAPRLAGASSEAGIRIEIGTHTLEVFYSVELDYDAQSRAIRDPSAALFSLAALIQTTVRDSRSAEPARIAGRKLKGKVDPSIVGVARPTTKMGTFPCTRYPGSIAPRDAD